MSRIKTATSALTAAALVAGISLAWAQTEENQPTDPMAAATASPTSEQSPADPNALPPVDNSLQQQQSATPPVDDPARTTPPADSTTTPLPSDSRSATDTSSYNNTPSTAPMATDSSYEPAPRADRN
jgi:hypothetical protein